MITNISEISSSTKFNWTIQNFSKLNPNVGFTHSDVFSVGSFKWKAQIYPKGSRAGYDCLSLYLQPVDLTIPMETKFNFEVTSQTDFNNGVKREATKTLTYKDTEGWGWPTFMRLSLLHNPDKGYIMNDTCVIKVEVTCAVKEEPESNMNEGGPNKVAKTENKKQTKEKHDNSNSTSGEYPGAGQPFGEGRHDYETCFGEDKEFEDIGGFSILKKQAPLYKQIWLKYGHIPSTEVMPISSYPILVMVVKDLMTTIIGMQWCRYVDLSSEMIKGWEQKIRMAEKNKFNIGWLRDIFENIKKGMCGMQRVKTELQEHGQPLRAAKLRVKAAADELKEAEDQLIAAKKYLRNNIFGSLSESDLEMYVDIGENLLLDGLFEKEKLCIVID